MKMSDVFELPLYSDEQIDRDIALDKNGVHACSFDTKSECDAAKVAINNHDKLVDAAIKLLVFVDAMQIIANRDCSHAEKVKRLKDGLKDHMLPYADELSALLKELGQ